MAAMTPLAVRPPQGEYGAFHAGYVTRVPPKTDPTDLLIEQADSIPSLLAVPEAKGGYRYAPGKWSVKEVVGHLCDAERIFAYRLLRIARADETPLPSFDENAFVPPGEFDARSLRDLVAEWSTARAASISLYRGLPAVSWVRQGTVSGKPMSARALAYILPGHAQHHVEVLKERYGLGERNSR